MMYTRKRKRQQTHADLLPRKRRKPNTNVVATFSNKAEPHYPKDLLNLIFKFLPQNTNTAYCNKCNINELETDFNFWFLKCYRCGGISRICKECFPVKPYYHCKNLCQNIL